MSDLYDLKAYTFENETPNELFVEVMIKTLHEYNTNIEILKSISAAPESWIIPFKTK